MLGIPYARALVRDGVYIVVCPVCHAEFGTKSSNEDAATKGANDDYGLHYVAVHADEEV